MEASRRRICERLLFSLALALSSTLPTATVARADPKPLWELGAGPAMIVLNDYRGADTSHFYPLPIPYFVYRGRFLQADRDGLKGRVFDDRYAEMHVSVSATPPVRNASIRAGMPDLRPTVEIGPALDLKLWHSAEEHVKLDFLTSARVAITIQAPPHAIGWIIDPHLNVDIDSPAGAKGWKLGVLSGPLFATQRYNDYFYTVAPQYATPERPAYQASGGYAGTQVGMSLTKRYPRYWTGAYVRYDTLTGATFADSPLVKRNSYWSAGFAVAWMISESSRVVEASD
jgi:outer membrane scaffolding protein for murein synthesis (MipA/OmpV family)